MPNFDFVITATAIGYATIEGETEQEARDQMQADLDSPLGADIDWQHYQDAAISQVERVEP